MVSNLARSWDYAVERLLKTEISNLSDALGQGSATSYEDYRYICGRIRGIRFAMECLTDTRGRLEDEDGDND